MHLSWKILNIIKLKAVFVVKVYNNSNNIKIFKMELSPLIHKE